MRTRVAHRLVGLAAIAAIVVAGCGQSTGTWPLNPPGQGGSAGPGEVDLPGTSSLAGEVPAFERGPDLGEAWTTDPDPDAFIEMPGGEKVATDQFLIMLDASSTRADAEKVAASVDGQIGGHIAYLGIWKIIVWPSFRPAIISDRLNTLSQQPGVEAASLVGLEYADGSPSCSSALDDPIYAGANSIAYDMIGVRGAWEAYFASGVPKSYVHVGVLDTELTRDSAGRIPWRFGDVTFDGDEGSADGLGSRAGGYRHGDVVVGLFAASGQGVAGPLDGRLVMSHDILGSRIDTGEKWTATDETSYTDANLIHTLHEIQNGATIISGSWGSGVGPGSAANAAMWRKFFSQMSHAHPEVLFVYSAGNAAGSLDGHNHFPGGISAPNVITVGNVNNDGSTNSTSNKPGSGGEVTLGAPGDGAVWGKGADGVVHAGPGGTSAAVPLVSGTAALMRSLAPDLKASELKRLILESSKAGPAGVGGHVLRADAAVLAAANKAREKANEKAGADKKLKALSLADLPAADQYCQLNVTTQLRQNLAQGSVWRVIAEPVTSAGPLSLSLTVNGMRVPNVNLHAGEGSAAWDVNVPLTGATIVVTRLDNDYWVKRRIVANEEPGPIPPPSAPIVPASPTPVRSVAGYDCSSPPPESDFQAYLDWKSHCQPIKP
jgi:hypothetical protein